MTIIKATKKLLMLTDFGKKKCILRFLKYTDGYSMETKLKSYTIDQIIKMYRCGYAWPILRFLIKDDEMGLDIEYSATISHTYRNMPTLYKNAVDYRNEEWLKDYADWRKE